MPAFIKSMFNKILINLNKNTKNKIKHGYPITITSGTLVPNYLCKSKANQHNAVVGTIHEVEMKQFRLFWMVEMVEINFDFLIKF